MLGVGRAGINLFSSLMEVSASLGHTTYYNGLDMISAASKSVFDSVTRKAVKEEKEKKNKELGNLEDELSVSGDVSWAKRGFSSLIGVITLIGIYTGKVLDVIKNQTFEFCVIFKK